MPMLVIPVPPEHPQFLPTAQLRVYALLMFPHDETEQRQYFNAVIEVANAALRPGGQAVRLAELLPLINGQLVDRARKPMSAGSGAPRIHPIWASALTLHGVIFANAYDHQLAFSKFGS
jgi:hypothetical protein